MSKRTSALLPCAGFSGMGLSPIPFMNMTVDSVSRRRSIGHRLCAEGVVPTDCDALPVGSVVTADAAAAAVTENARSTALDLVDATQGVDGLEFSLPLSAGLLALFIYSEYMHPVMAYRQVVTKLGSLAANFSLSKRVNPDFSTIDA